MHHTIRLISYSVLLILILSSLIYSINSNKQSTEKPLDTTQATQAVNQKRTMLRLGESHVIKGVRFVFQQMNTAQNCLPPTCSPKEQAEAIVSIIVGGTTEVLRVSGTEPTLYANFALEITQSDIGDSPVDNLFVSIVEIQ